MVKFNELTRIWSPVSDWFLYLLVNPRFLTQVQFFLVLLWVVTFHAEWKMSHMVFHMYHAIIHMSHTLVQIRTSSCVHAEVTESRQRGKSGHSGVAADMLLENQQIRELFVAHRTLVHHAQRRLGTMNSHVRLQIAFCCE